MKFVLKYSFNNMTTSIAPKPLSDPMLAQSEKCICVISVDGLTDKIYNANVPFMQVPN